MFIFNAVHSILEFDRENKFEGNGISEKIGYMEQLEFSANFYFEILSVPSKQKTVLEIGAHQ